MTDTERRKKAKEFVEYWQNKGYEKGESQTFWLTLLRDVLGIDKPEQFITFEEMLKTITKEDEEINKEFIKRKNGIM